MEHKNFDNLRNTRLIKELRQFAECPYPGLSLYPIGDAILNLGAQIVPVATSPYRGKTFRLQVTVPERYPFSPPTFRFVTPIFHPNIDSSGICLDILGDQYLASMKIEDLLNAIRELMESPNFEDPLRPEVAYVFQTNQPLYYELTQCFTWDLPAEIYQDYLSHSINQVPTTSKRARTEKSGLDHELQQQEAKKRKL